MHTIRHPFVRSLLAATLALAGRPAPASSVAQAAPACPVHVVIPGFSNPEDRTRHACGLDRRPVLRDGLERLGQPVHARQVYGSLIVVVDADGRVNAALTRWLSLGGDRPFFDAVIETIRGWVFEPGVLNGAAIRSGFQLDVLSDARTDTLPEALRWEIVPGERADTLRGRWVATGPARTPTLAERLGAIQAATRRLLHMQVLSPRAGLYCLLVDGATEPEAAAIRTGVDRVMTEIAVPLAHVALAPRGCERDPRFLRYHVSGARATEQRRIVLAVAGDHLSAWPPGFDARSWRAWTARCVVPDVDDASGGDARCDVLPVLGAEPVSARGTPQVPGARSAGNAVAFMLEVTTAGAFRNDTLAGVLDGIPHVAERAVYDEGLGMCAGGEAWQVFTEEPDRQIRLVRMALPAGGENDQHVRITEARTGRPDTFGGRRCPDLALAPRPFALFFLRGFGDAPGTPVTYCLNEPGCTRRYTVEPGRHELAEAPHLVFRVGDLRPATREGGTPLLQLTIDRAIPGLVPFVIIERPTHTSGFQLHRVNERVFRLNVAGEPYPEETRFLLYLVRAPA